MNPSVDDVKALLTSADYGDRINGVNQARYLDRAIAFDLLKGVAVDPNARIRYAAVSQMAEAGKVNPEAAAELLRNLLHNDSEVDVQAAAADALAALRCAGAFEDLAQVFEQSTEWLLRMSIVASLGELGDPRAFDLLASALTAGDGLILISAIGALGELGDPRAVPLLIPFATDEDWQIRYRTVQALGRLGGAEAHATLASMVNDPVEQIAQESQAALNF